jgi:hypothetical protein
LLSNINLSERSGTGESKSEARLSGGRAGDGLIAECASSFHSYSKDELGCLDHGTLHRLLSSDSLSVESEDWLLRMLIDLDLGCSRSEFFGRVEFQYLTAEGLSQFIDAIVFDDLTEALWLQFGDRVKGGVIASKFGRCGRLIDSTIVNSIPWILRDFHRREWTLLYRGSRDGFASSNFHGQCDGKSNTVTLIETTNGHIFGGFTPLAWDSSTGSTADRTRGSFLFTLKNPRGTAERKFSLLNASCAICSHSSYGPRFGSNADISVADGCNGNASSYTHLGAGYENDTGLDGKQVFTGEYYFTAKEVEVFSIAL